MRGLTCLYDSLKSITLEYKNQLMKIFDEIDALLKEVTNQIQRTFKRLLKDVEDRVSEAKDRVKDAIDQSQKVVETQLNKLKEKLRPAQNFLWVGGKIWRGVKSVVSWIGWLFPIYLPLTELPDLPSVPDFNIDIPNVNLDSFNKLKNWLKSFTPDIDLIDLKTWSDIQPLIKHSSITDIRQKLKGILKGFFRLIQDYCSFAKKLFHLSILLIIWDAVVYMRRYYSDLSYITRLLMTICENCGALVRKRKSLLSEHGS